MKPIEIDNTINSVVLTLESGMVVFIPHKFCRTEYKGDDVFIIDLIGNTYVNKFSEISGHTAETAAEFCLFVNRFAPTPFYVKASLGDMYGISVMRKFGHNLTVATGAYEILSATAEVSTTYEYLLTAKTLSIVSTDDQDKPLGTGATAIRLTGLDENYLEITEDIALNGLTPVLTTNQFFRLTAAFVLTPTTITLSLPVGSIIISAQTTNECLGVIPATYGRTQQLVYTVPATKKLLLTLGQFSASKLSVGNSPVVRFRGEFKTPNTAWQTLFERVLDSGAQSVFQTETEITDALPEKSELRTVIQTDVNGTEVFGQLTGLLIKDGQ